jgi:hypothetical protein
VAAVIVVIGDELAQPKGTMPSRRQMRRDGTHVERDLLPWPWLAGWIEGQFLQMLNELQRVEG